MIENEDEFFKKLQGVITSTVEEVVEKKLNEKSNISKGGQNIPTEEDLKNRPEPPSGSQSKRTVTARKKAAVVNEDFTVSKEIREGVKTPVKAGANTFVDDGTLEKDDFDEKVERVITPRVRAEAEIVEIICAVCGKKERLPASQITSREYHRCSNCVGR